MKIRNTDTRRVASELEIIEEQLPISGARVLELGCGRAWMTRRIAKLLQPARIIATEVDRIQHEKNQQIDDLPGVSFVYGGAQSIDLPEASVDLVLMLKSLHHVPPEQMDQGLTEICRVLGPGGLAYISEPVFQGDFNDIMRLFHDERKVRQCAFDALQRAIDGGRFELVNQIFFLSPSHYRDFEEFEERILKVTHTQHQIDPQLHQRIRQAFERHMTRDGADFLQPCRVDLLRKTD